MKKLRYSAGMKATVLAAEQILIVVLVLCLLLLLLLHERNILNFGEKSSRNFEESGYFTDQFAAETKAILQFVELRRKFETNGVYDEEKLVDIGQYYERQELSEELPAKRKKNTIRYYLGDLAEWAREYQESHFEFVSEYYVENDEIQQKQNIYKNDELVFSEGKTISSLREMAPELREVIIQNVEHRYGGAYSTTMIPSYMEDEQQNTSHSDQKQERIEQTDHLKTESKEIDVDQIIEKIISGQLYELSVGELQWVLADMEMKYVSKSSQQDFVEEMYLPVGKIGIWENFMKGNFSLEQMRNAYQALGFTLKYIGEEVSMYKKYLNNYNLASEGSNLIYLVVKGKEGNLFTNMKNILEMDLPAYGKSLGKYLYYQEEEVRLETNVKGMEELFYSSLEPAFGKKGNGLFVAVNTKFPHADRFLEAKQEYSRLHPWIKISLWGAALSFLFALICLIYLSIVAGKRDDTGEVYLNLFDRIPTEVMFLLAAVQTIIFIFAAASMFYRFGGDSISSLMMLSGGITFAGTVLFMVFYLSFVRRIRAGVLWSHSILRWFLCGIALLFSSRKSSTKMVIWFGLHFMACLCILPMLAEAYYTENFWAGVFLFLLLCGVEAVLIIREGVQRNKVLEGIGKIASGNLEYKIAENELRGDNRRLAAAVNAIGDGLYHAVDDSMKNERLQVDLITNVSHDIKTPLTSIINYVDLLKREDLQNERACSYIAVLDSKSQRLKQLTEDLVEVSRISSGNITLNIERINLVELVHQTEGEFAEKFEARSLQIVSNLPKESVVILADGRRIWRVLENIYNNVAKYAMERTRVYVDMQADGTEVLFSIKNISENPLNIQADELTERFIRGDVSRSTEGSGLGLSIAKNLTMMMGGSFQIYLDGDLFKVMLSFAQEPENQALLQSSEILE